MQMRCLGVRGYLLLAFSLCALSLLWMLSGCREPDLVAWTYNGQLHAAIEMADRIVIRDGGHDRDDAIVDRYAVIDEITIPAEVKDVFVHLTFRSRQQSGRCGCTGYPMIDWYCGDERLARVSVQHGTAVRWYGDPAQPWNGVQGDVALTEESCEWLVRWLVRHGVAKEDMHID